MQAVIMLSIIMGSVDLSNLIPTQRTFSQGPRPDWAISSEDPFDFMSTQILFLIRIIFISFDWESVYNVLVLYSHIKLTEFINSDSHGGFCIVTNVHEF